MLHSRTKTVKAYGKRSNTRVINIHTDFHDAIHSEKAGNAKFLAKGNDQVLQDKTAENAFDDSSEDDGSDAQASEEGNKKETNVGKRNAAKRKGGKVAKKATPIDKAALARTARRDVEISLDSSRTQDTMEDPDASFRSTVPASDSVPTTSPSSRPVRNRRNVRKIVESSGESDSQVDDDSADDSAGPDVADLEEPEIIARLNGLSIVQAPENHLTTLLGLCEQESAHDFSSFVVSHSITAAGSPTINKKGRKPIEQSNVFRKIGEASYSEVFGVWSGTADPGEESPRVVMKVVPLDLASEGTSTRSTTLGEETDEDEVCLTRVEDVIKEIEITRLMNGVHEGFVKLHEAHVVRGAYPETLLQSWDAFKAERGSESPRPDCLPADQHFLLLFLENAGTDLESFAFDKTCGWRQAVDVLWQVADSLATAEKEAEFEHRDLHEGQVLLANSEMGQLRATIIDFGLSRAKSAVEQELFWSKIPEDVFDGQGEQWDVYRAMKTHIETSGNDWDGFHPVTNLMWLHYLTKRLLYATPTLVKPRSKALSRVISRRDPSRSPIRRRATRNTAASLATPMAVVSLDQGAELEAWEKLRRFESACRAGLLESAETRQVARGEKGKPNRSKTATRGIAKASDVVSSVKEATLWFVDNE